MPIHTERTEFVGSQGHALAGRWELPEGRPTAYAVFAHCFTCGKDVVAATRISHALVENGIAVLRFDFTGLGGSQGDFANTDFSSNVKDLVAAGRWLEERGHPPALLVGHSLGGAAVLAAVEQLPSVRAVVTIGAPAGPEHVLGLIRPDQLEQVATVGKAEVQLAGRTFCIRRDFLDDIADQPQAERLKRLNAALLVLHAPGDQTVDVEDARRIFDHARHPKSFVPLDGANHLLTDKRDAEYAASLIALWARRHLVIDADEPVTPPPEGVVLVSSDDAGLGQTIRAGLHLLRADEPLPMGADTGPSPYDFLLAGLGSCTAMTVQLYARRKRWDLRAVEVSLRHGRRHLDDCEGGCAGHAKGCRIEVIDRTVVLTGELDDEQRARLLEIADRCPVHRTMTGDLRVRTVLS